MAAEEKTRREKEEKARKEAEERKKRAKEAAEKKKAEAKAKKEAEEAAKAARLAEVTKSVEEAEAIKKARREALRACCEDAAMESRKKHTANKKKLKSDLKKATAFNKKVKELVPNQIAAMVKDVGTLNLFMYVSEIVAALHSSETLVKLKASEVPGLTELIMAFHTRYDSEKFTGPLLSALSAVALDDSLYRERAIR